MARRTVSDLYCDGYFTFSCKLKNPHCRLAIQLLQIPYTSKVQKARLRDRGGGVLPFGADLPYAHGSRTRSCRRGA
jgi:hypothetical protein